MRNFRDAAGVDWRVYLTERREPGGRRDHYLPEEFLSGWLTFESATEKRRLAPVPPNWEALSDEALAALCATAGSRALRRGQPAADAAPAPSPSVQPLAPELHRVQQQLEESLEQVCEAPEVEKLDTGELIRVEETLAIAAETAKEAVALRRKLRRQGENADDERRPERRE